MSGVLLFDESLNGFTGTASGGTGTPVPKYPGFDFVATSTQYIDIGTGPTSVKTVMLWVDPDAVDVTDTVIDLNGTDYLTIVEGVLTKNGFAGGTTLLYFNGATKNFSELITEGTAPPDLDSWTQSPGTQWAVVDSNFVGTGNSDQNFLAQDFGGVIGKTYTVSYTVVDNSLSGGGEFGKIKMAPDSIFDLVETLSSAEGVHSYNLPAIKTSHTVDFNLYITKFALSGTITLDAISVKENITTPSWHLIGITDTSAKNADDFDIGRKDTAYFDGLISDVRLYDRVLTAIEVKNLYELTRGKYAR